MAKDKTRKKSQTAEMEDEHANTKSKQQFVVQPEEGGSKMNAKDWPLLLKNYDQMNVLSTHYTPIPAGSTPLKRPLK